MSEPVRRPASITAAAVVALLGSFMTFFAAVMMITTAFIGPEPVPATDVKAPMIVMGAVLGMLAVLGVWTSVGLLKLRRWARPVILVFAGVLVVFGLLGLAVALLVPLPTAPGAGEIALPGMQPIMIATFGFPLLVGAWWLVLFTRESVKAAFAAAAGGSGIESAMPLSISITAWASIIGGAACLLPIVTRLPVVVLGFALTGWAAGVFYAFMGALSIYIGRGLLDLDERARLLCIAWYGLSVVHMGLVSFVPSLHARTLEAQRRLQVGYGLPPSAETPAFVWLMFLLIVLIAVLAFVFLHRHRALFRHSHTIPE